VAFPDFSEIDLTLVILTYRRPQCLTRQLRMLEAQTYKGSWELILWNNNPAIGSEIEEAARTLTTVPVTFVTSSTNYIGRARFAAAELARGRLLALCDDDLIPGEGLLQQFVRKYETYGPQTVLCGAGQRFASGAGATLESSHHFGFGDPDCEVNYAHFSMLLASTALFRAAARAPMPERDLVLIDDLWLSHVLSEMLGARLVKIQCDAAWDASAGDPSIALHRDPVVRERLQSFIREYMRGDGSVRRTPPRERDEPSPLGLLELRALMASHARRA
jgi:hypothetical protein